MLRRIGRNQRGQGLVEFAVIFPLIVILLFIIIDGGLVMGRSNTITNAATEGARYGAVQGGDSDDAIDDIIEVVQAHAHGMLDNDVDLDCNDFDDDDNIICVQWLDGPDNQDPGDVGSYLRVVVKHPYRFLTPLPDFIPGLDTWDISTCALVRVERPIDIDDSDHEDPDEGCDDFDRN